MLGAVEMLKYIKTSGPELQGTTNYNGSEFQGALGVGVSECTPGFNFCAPPCKFSKPFSPPQPTSF